MCIIGVQAESADQTVPPPVFSWDKTDRSDAKDFVYKDLKAQNKVKPPGSVCILLSFSMCLSSPYQAPRLWRRSIQGQQFIIDSCEVGQDQGCSWGNYEYSSFTVAHHYNNCGAELQHLSL